VVEVDEARTAGLAGGDLLLHRLKAEPAWGAVDGVAAGLGGLRHWSSFQD
jgi:hypothetical protein